MESKEAVAARRARNLLAGRCPNHKGERVSPGRTTCSRCQDINRRSSLKRLRRLRGSGFCVRHPTRLLATGRSCCAECLEAAKHDAKNRRTRYILAGLCQRCGQVPPFRNCVSCLSCLEECRDRTAKSRGRFLPKPQDPGVIRYWVDTLTDATLIPSDVVFLKIVRAHLAEHQPLSFKREHRLEKLYEAHA